MASLQQAELLEPRIALPGKRKRSPFNFHDPEFNFHDPEYLAYIESAPREVKEEAVGAALAAAEAQVAAGYVIKGSFEDVRRWLREGRSLEYVLRKSRSAENSQ